MKTKKPWWRNRLVWTLVLSSLFHISFLAIKFPEFSKKTNPLERKLVVMSLDESKVNLEKIKENIAKRENEKGQVVNTEQNGRKVKPEDSRFLGKADQTFDRQSVVATVGSFKEAGKGKKNGSPDAREKENKVTQVAKKEQQARKNIGELSLSDFALNKEQLPTNQKREQESKLAAFGLERGKEGTTGLAQNNDYVEDIPLGDMTQFNTQEFKYFGFYDRIRQKLEQFWGQSLHEKAKAFYKTGRRMPAGTDSITSLKVTLDDKGNIIHVEIRSTSGVREFDDAAIESFNKAGPFPNPPHGMIKDGLAEIEWGFVVKS